MAITWRLRQPMPTEVYQASTIAVASARWWVEDEGGNVVEFHDDFSPPPKPMACLSRPKSG
jgi:uncharacterized protein YndB with AHSA1/START domain